MADAPKVALSRPKEEAVTVTALENPFRPFTVIVTLCLDPALIKIEVWFAATVTVGCAAAGTVPYVNVETVYFVGE